jgi:two-component system, OmpR family, sensor histidine kinase KdpD
VQAGTVVELRGRWGTSGAARIARGSAAAVLLPIAATAIGSAIDLRPFGPPSLYLLAVVATTAIGGLAAGLAAAAISFLGLNYFFTPPEHTLRVSKPADLVALLVFLVVAGIVGILFGRALTERERAERREEEVRLANRFAARLLSSELAESLVREFASALVDRFSLSWCEVAIDGEPALSATVIARGSPPAGSTGDGPSAEAPIALGTESLGRIRAGRPSGGRRFSEPETRLLATLGGQLGLAVERHRLDLRAREARTDAEVAEIRAALFSSVTHDLRTPLASIKAGITGLMDAGVTLDPAERKELFDTVLEETDRLGRLVENLLRLARARAGGIAVEKELTPFEDVVETVLSRLRHTLAPFRIRTKIGDDFPAVWVDPVQMDQALTNILENAAHHAPGGSEIVVAVTPWRGGIEVRVADRGPGIPPEDRDRVFEPFFRRDTETGRAGSGLGLAIARAVVQAHAGRIRIEGAPGGGAAVVIELPVGVPAEAAP